MHSVQRVGERHYVECRPRFEILTHEGVPVLLQSFEALGPSPDGLAFVRGMRLRSAIFALSNLASWSRIPSVSSPSGLSPPRSFRHGSSSRAPRTPAAA